MLVKGAIITSNNILYVVFYKAVKHAPDHNYHYNSAWSEREKMRLKEVESASPLIYLLVKTYGASDQFPRITICHLCHVGSLFTTNYQLLYPLN